MIRRCSWCQKILGEKEPLEDKSYTDGCCDECLPQVLRECAPEVAVEEDEPAVIFKCGCMWGGGSSTREAHFIKLCWQHGG